MENTVDWKEVLGWQEDQLDDMKFFGFSYLREGKYEVALKIFLALKVLAPKDLYTLKTLGALYLTLNEPQKALTELQTVLSLDPNDPKVQLNLAQALLDLGQREEALKKAKTLCKSKNTTIAGKAKALILGWGK